MTATANVIIIIMPNTNHFSPVLDKPSYLGRIDENADPDTQILTITAADGDAPGTDAATIANITLSGADTSSFYIDYTGNGVGILRSKVIFDYEEQQEYVNLQVQAQDSGNGARFSTLSSITVRINNLNDNFPKFGQETYSISRSENGSTPLNTIIATVNATDKDNDTITFSIVADNASNPNLTVSGTGDIQFEGPDLLDYEQDPKNFYYTLSATDGSNTDTAVLNLTVEDINDNVPLFENDSYIFELDENTPTSPAVSIGNVMGTDADSGVNAELTYSSDSTMFTVMPNGTVVPSVVFNYEDQTNYTFTATVSDNGSPSMSSDVTVTVNILDVNDELPMFDQSASSLDPDNITIPENATGNLGTIIFIDGDQPGTPSSTITYSLSEGNGSSFFNITETDGMVYVQSDAVFDYEDASMRYFTVIVTASDGGTPPLNGTITLNIYVTNIDDEDPQFTKPEYAFSIAENAGIGSNVGAVEAVDPDPFGQELVYEIDQTLTDSVALGFFVINSNTGNISTNSSINLEGNVAALHVLYVNVKYGNTVKDSATVNITVTDVNEAMPMITQFDHITITENTPADVNVSVAKAFDPDVNSVLRFSLSSPNSVLRIDAVSGTIYTNKVIDREEIVSQQIPCPSDIPSTTTCFSIILIVEDQTTTDVDIEFRRLQVVDEDDTAPYFLLPFYSVSISEDQAIGSALTALDIEARDPDLEIILAFSISPSDGDFKIHDRSAVVSIVNKLDYETKNNYSLTVIATDTNGNTGNVTLNITITDFNDNAPEFPESSYSTSIEEDTSASVVVIEVTAEDIDSPGMNSDITYSIIAGDDDGYFTIATNTSGEITTARSDIDREKTNNFTLTVQAQDNGQPRLNTTVSVFIDITDLNDEAPVFTADVYYGYILESAANGDPVLSNGTGLPLYLQANDPDLNDVLTYVIYGISPFTVNSSTSLLTKTGAIDYDEGDQSYVLFCHVRDSVGRSPSPSEVHVEIINVDDNIPVFTESTYTKSVAEDTELSSTILTVAADDLDRDVVNFQLDHSGSLPFTLNATSGALVLTTALDYETNISYNFNVLASSDNFANSSSATVDITVTNVNDLPPVFEKDLYTANVFENTTVQNVLNVTATDGDYDHVIKYQLYSGDTEFFSINEDTGVISSNNMIDFESNQELYLVVLAYNPDDKLFNSTTAVNITVKDINDESPVFENDTYTVNVHETAPIDYVALTVTATDDDTVLAYRTVTYSIKEASPSGYFSINSSTGEIYLVAKLPHVNNQSSHALTVEAADGGSPANTATVEVTIIVSDINMAPQFEKNSYTTNSDEDTEVRTIVLEVKATEESDTGVNSEIKYAITTPPGHVLKSVECPTPMPDSSEPDYESGSGSNSGDGSGSGSAEPDYELDDDSDSLDDSADDLSIACYMPPVFPFTINETTGAITLAYSLDYETNTSWTFYVTAMDLAISPLNDTTMVTINVNDINDEPPTFTQSNYTIRPREDAPVNKVLTDIVKAEDNDTVGDLVYSILSGGDGKFTINETNGNITLVQSLEPITYTLVIEVVNGLYKVNVTLKVIVQDVNNNAPMFEQTEYSDTFPESATAGYSIIQVSAPDSDPVHSDVVYSIIMGGDLFYINSTSGEIHANSTYDYDSGTTVYELVVMATDGHNNDTVNITLTLTDVNDNAPQLDDISEVLQEGMYTKGFVYDVNGQATDIDSGINQEITYSLFEDDESEQFTMVNGIVFASGDFDYDVDFELDRIFYLTIIVTDGGDPALSSNATLEITLTDINDNAPVFPQPIYTQLIPETTLPTEDAFVANATDADSGDNALLTYTLSSSCNNTYTINNATGAVRLVKQIDAESAVFNLECTLTITATDNGTPARSGFTVYIATITDINEHAPVFSSPLIAYVPENSPAGYEFYTIAVTDIDPNPISYELVGGAFDLFSVEESTGILSVIEDDTLDYESSERVYNLTIEGIEMGKPVITITQTITIMVNDTNDEAPEFEFSTYAESVRENEPVGHTITTVRAQDFDTAPENTKVRYSFALNSENETNYGKFSVDDETGDITIATALDYELEQRIYDMVVEASDGVHTNTTTLRIRVLESNDNSPNITNLPATISIGEDATNGTYIYTVKATDKDTGVNMKITYSLDLGVEQEDIYRIDPDTGVIRINTIQPFDYESGFREEQIVVVATDRAGQPGSGFAQYGSGFGEVPITNIMDGQLSTQKILTILITDVNDEVPTFSQEIYTANIIEHQFNKILVLQVVATDGDQPNTNNSKIGYKIADGDFGKFEIDSTGIITTIPPIDREDNSSFTLIVTAYDFGVPSNEKNVTVIISVLDINDGAPQFTLDVYSGKVVENSAPGVSVAIVTAIDFDINDTLTYSIIDNIDSYFTIDENGTIYTTNATIDREVTSSMIMITVQAEDSSNFIDTATVVIIVEDVNDSPPDLSQATYIFNISENTPIDHILDDSTIDSTDKDLSDNAITNYALQQDAGRLGKFKIDVATGEISVAGDLCSSTILLETYTFTLSATDTGNSSLSDTATVDILVYQENLYPPVFVRPSYVSRLDELAKAGTEVIGSLSTTDADPCSGPRLYDISAGNVNDTFSINPDTGRILLARDLTSTDVSFTLTLSATDTGNFGIQSLTGEVTLIVLIGQLLPLEISTQGVTPVATISRVSQYEYIQNMWLYNGLAHDQPLTINYTLGNLQESDTITLTTPPAADVNAAIITDTVYYDNPVVMVALQVEATDSERTYVAVTEVTVQISLLGSVHEPVTASCSSDQYSGGICMASVSVPASWFTDNEHDNVTVEYRTESTGYTTLGSVSMEMGLTCSDTVSSPHVSVQIPQQVYYKDQVVEVEIYGNANYDVHNFRITCDMGEGVAYKGVSSAEGFIAVARATDTEVSITGSTTMTTVDVNKVSEALVYLATLELQIDYSPTDAEYVGLQCTVNHLVNVRNEQVLTEEPAGHISLMNDSCMATEGGILVAPNNISAIFGHADQAMLHNTPRLNDEMVSVNIHSTCFNSAGAITDCEPSCSSDATVLAVAQDCGSVYLNGQETGGSSDHLVTLKSNGLQATIPFTVWYPTVAEIVVETATLQPIANAFTDDCTPIYEKTDVEIEVRFVAGSLMQSAVMTSIVIDSIASSDNNILELVKDNGKVQAVGKATGTTTITLSGDLATSLDITVSKDPATVSDISFSLVTSLTPKALDTNITGPPYTSMGQVAIDRDLNYINTVATVISEVVLDNGHNYDITGSTYLQLTSDDKEVIKVINSQQVNVRGSGNGLLLSGSWPISQCTNAKETSSHELIEFTIEDVSELVVMPTESRLAVSVYAKALNLPVSTTYTVTLVYSDGTRRDSTTDARLTINDTQSLLTYDNGVATVGDELVDAPPTTTINVNYISPDISTSGSTNIDIVSITDLTLTAHPYPSYANSPSIEELSYIASTGVFQQAELRLIATLNNGETEDLSNSPFIDYSLSNNTVLAINGTLLLPTTPGYVNITASVADITASLIIDVLDDSVSVVKLQNLLAGFGTTFADVEGATDRLTGLIGNFSDDTLIPDLLYDDGPFLNNFLSFSSLDESRISVHNTTGLLTLLRNTYTPVTITVQHVDNPNITSSTSVHGNILPALGDADFGNEDNSPLPELELNSNFTLPIFVNTNATSVGAIELQVRYTSAVFTISKQATIGGDAAIFESSFGDNPGEISFGVVFHTDTPGKERLHVADLELEVVGDVDWHISIDILTLNEYNSTYAPIGSATPRSSIAATVDTTTAARKRRQTPAMTFDEPTRCPSPPCTKAMCEALGYSPSVGDANQDCIFDTLDALATIQQTTSLSNIDDEVRATMDVNRDDRIDIADVSMLMSAAFNLYPLVSDIVVRPIAAEYSDCHIVINVTLAWGDGSAINDNTYLIVGLFHNNETFAEQYDNTTLAMGTKIDSASLLPLDAYGGWIEAAHLGHGVFSVVTKPGNISQTDPLGVIFVYGDKRQSPQERSVVVIGNPTPPLQYGALNISLPISDTNSINVVLPAGFNPQQMFDNTFTANLCYNNYAPVITNSPITRTISENTELNDIIATVNVEDGDSPLPAGNILFTMTFMDASQEGLIAIHPTSGAITVNGTLDKESYDEIKTVVTATDQGPHVYTRMSDSTAVDVFINDFNDHTPIPEQDVYSRVVSEGLLVPSGVLLTVSATDGDVNVENKRLRYVIIDGDRTDNPFFKLDSITGELTLISELDRETEDFYNLTVEISDSVSDPINYNYTYIEITVTDVNDNPPVFEQEQSTTEIIYENEPEDFVLITINATDADIGINKEFTYRISNLEHVDVDNVFIKYLTPIEDYFTIDAVNGEIVVQKSFDRELISRVKLVIVADDGVNEPYLLLYVSICEENDNNPVINETHNYTWEVDEHSGTGVMLDYVRATDADVGTDKHCEDELNSEDNVIHYSILTQNFTAFIIHPMEGSITLNEDIDYEEVHNFTVLILAQDLGVPPPFISMVQQSQIV